jgi:two-component system, NtrC family, nitrogen regulation sensor histidine kinase NtrY
VGSEVVLEVLDNGPGLTNANNLFVPFYTTKPGGTGIGLVLAQQIAQAHRGSVQLANRRDGHGGCRAELRLPIVG